MNIEKLLSMNLEKAVEGNSTELLATLDKYSLVSKKASIVKDCIQNGYTPANLNLADFSIIKSNGYFHLFFIPRIPQGNPLFPGQEHWFGHAVSKNLDTWTTVDPALLIEPNNYYESSHIWAPFIFQKDEFFYMIYTGLSNEFSQVLCMAYSNDPDLKKWKRFDNNPITPITGFNWHWLNNHKHTRHARDPHVICLGNDYIIYYTAMYKNGCPAVGALYSKDLEKWDDIGPVLYRSMKQAIWLPESVNVQKLSDGRWVLISSQTPGLEYYISDSPFSWHNSRPIKVAYFDKIEDEPAAIEVIQKNNETMKWLVAYFGNTHNRLMIGEMNIGDDPWTLKRIRHTELLEPWSVF